MQNDPELNGKYLGTITKDFAIVADTLKEASYQIRKRDISKFPIFIFSKLALIGSLETVPVVQPFVEHPQWGVEAVNAIRAIQTR